MRRCKDCPAHNVVEINGRLPEFECWLNPSTNHPKVDRYNRCYQGQFLENVPPKKETKV